MAGIWRGGGRMLMALGVGMVIGAFVSLAASASAATPVGLWRTASDEGRYLHVRITPCEDGEGRLCGTIEGAFGGADTANIGRRIIWDMTPEGDDAWSDGRVWAADEDETYSAEMELKSADVLELSGCILGGLICRGQDWTRVE